MRISSRGQYGIRALAVLATRHGQGPIQVREIARVENLSAKYLEQLLGRLRSGGLVKSVRGARGGYQLSRAPEAITVRDVLVLLEGSLAPVGCIEPGSTCGSDGQGPCVAHGLWAGLHDTVLGYLSSYTLADLAAATEAKAATSPAPPAAVRELITAGTGE